MLFALRFDFRNPPLAATSMADRYAAALDMVEWADGRGCVNVTISEHHGSDDGYLPSPIVMLGAMAARTTSTRFMIAALIAPFHDPLRIAEDMLVLDNLSRGRVDLLVAGGYVPDEFAMFDVPLDERAKRVTEMVHTLKAAFAGEPFEFRGRTVHVTPTPFRPGGPSVMLGGSSEPAARRAARIADGFVPSESEVWEPYRDECLKLGKPDPGPCPIPPKNRTVALAEDAEKGWDQMAPFFLHETNAYGAWAERSDAPSPYGVVQDIDALRKTGMYVVLTPDQFIEEIKAAPFPFAMFHPLCGGMPPDLAWESLKLFERDVMPEFPS